MKRPIFLFFWLFTSLAAAAPLASGADPTQVADRAVQAWITQQPVNISSLAGESPEALCAALPGLVSGPPSGTDVNLKDRLEHPSQDPSVKIYTYPAALPAGRLQIVEVKLQKTGNGWQSSAVGFQQGNSPGALPKALRSPVAGWLFIAFSLYFLFLLVRPSFFRRWLAEGWQVIRRHRRVVIATIVILYGCFILGALGASGLPQSCATAVNELLSSSLSSLGATSAYASGSVPVAAVNTVYQNFLSGTLLTTFLPAIFFGIPAYILNGLRYGFLGVAFGLVGHVTAAYLLVTGILLILELMAYILVTAGGGILLATLVREGFGGLQKGFKSLVLMLPVAFLLLMAGAWYEATVIILAGQ
jgi:hypothetical protein